MFFRFAPALALALAFGGPAPGQSPPTGSNFPPLVVSGSSPDAIRSGTVPAPTWIGGRPIPNFWVDPNLAPPVPLTSLYNTANAADAEVTTVTGASITRAATFHNAAYTGSRAVVANIEAGTPSLTHETMTW